MVKNPSANAGDVRDAVSLPGLERSSGGGHENPLEYFGVENSMDRGSLWVTIHEVTKNWT